VVDRRGCMSEFIRERASRPHGTKHITQISYNTHPIGTMIIIIYCFKYTAVWCSKPITIYTVGYSTLYRNTIYNINYKTQNHIYKKHGDNNDCRLMIIIWCMHTNFQNVYIFLFDKCLFWIMCTLKRVYFIHKKNTCFNILIYKLINCSFFEICLLRLNI